MAETQIIITAKDAASAKLNQVADGSQKMARGFQTAQQHLASLDRSFQSQTNSMMRNLVSLQEGVTRNSLVMRNWAVTGGQVARELGLNQTQFAALNQRFLQTQAAESQAQALRSIQRAAGLTRGEIMALASQMNVSRAAMSRFAEEQGRSFSLLGFGRAGLSALGVTLGADMITSGIGSSARAALRKENIEYAFAAIEGGADRARGRLGFMREESERLGLAFYDSTEQAKKFFASAKDTEVQANAEEILSAFLEMGAALKLPQRDMESVIRAIGQMMSKGKVTAEELRTQLAEVLPGTFQLMARAIGVTTRELDAMLQRGDVGLDALLKTARLVHNEFSGPAAQAARGLQAEMGRVSTTWTDLKAGFIDTGGAAAALRGVNVILKGTLTTLEAIKGVVSSISESVPQQARDTATDVALSAMSGSGHLFGLGGYLTSLGKRDAAAAEVSAADRKELERAFTYSDYSNKEFGRAVMERKNAMREAADYTKTLAENMRAEVEKDYKAVLDSITLARAAGRISAAEFGQFKSQLDRVRADKLEAIDRKNKEEGRWLKPEETSAYDPDGVFEARKRRREQDKAMSRKGSEEDLKLKTEFAEKHRSVVLGETEFKLAQIEEQANAYKRAGADAVAVEQWAAQERLNISRKATDGMTRGFKSWADSATNSAKHAENAITTVMSGIDATMGNVWSGQELRVKDLVDSWLNDFGRMWSSMNLTGPMAKIFSGSSLADAGGIFSLFASHHDGGIVGRKGGGRAVSPLAFVGAPRYHSGGIVGPGERAIIARDDEEVLTESNPRHIRNIGSMLGGGSVYAPSFKAEINMQVQGSTGSVQRDEAYAKKVADTLTKGLDAWFNGKLDAAMRPGGKLNKGGVL